MRIAVASALSLICLLALSSCANDAPPTYVEQQPAAPTLDQSPEATQERAPLDDRQPDSEPPSEPGSGHDAEPGSAADAELESERQSASEPRANRHLIMRLHRAIEVFAWPGDVWLPVADYGPGTLLLADGWTRQPDGVIWLRLDLNQDRVGWVRLEASPLSVEEAQSLPLFPQPALPVAQLPGPNNGALTVSLLGRSADGDGVVVRFAGSGLSLRVERSMLESAHNFSRLPVYAGDVIGQWQPLPEHQASGLEVEVWNWNPAISAWPGGPRLAYRLQWDRYPVLGRSLDSKWIALRVESLEPPVIWLPADSWRLELELENLPIVLSAGLEVVSLDADGRAVSSVFGPEPTSYWEWRNARELLLSEWNSGTWLWDPKRDESWQVSSRRLANISPDGTYAVTQFQTDQAGPIDWRVPWNVVLVSLEDGAEISFVGVYKPWGTDAPGFQQFWSADSQWLYSTVATLGEPDEPTRHFALSVSGALVEIMPPEGEWVVHWGALRAVEQAGGVVRYANAEGEPIDRPWSDGVLDSAPPTAEDYPELPEGWWPQAWSPDGRLLIATRRQWTDEFDQHGLAALPRSQPEGWGTYEIGIFDQHGKLHQVFRGFGGLDCAQWRSDATWSPDSTRILFAPRWTGCA